MIGLKTLRLLVQQQFSHFLNTSSFLQKQVEAPLLAILARENQTMQQNISCMINNGDPDQPADLDPRCLRKKT